MKKIIVNCDICGIEFPPQEFSFLNGVIIKIDKDLKTFSEAFEGHYCGECTKKVLEKISELRNENTNPPGMGKSLE